jgi:DNA mismatch repair protein MSH6
MRALGGILFQLQRCLIDYEILSSNKFIDYIPPDVDANTNQPLVKSDSNPKHHLILDAVALSNLEVLVNNFDHTESGSLWNFLNRCHTPFGKRLLREWVCKPLYSVSAITTRRNAVDELMNLDGDMVKVRTLLKTLPDVERLLSRVHCNGLLKRSTTHPDSRAVMYEPKIYNCRKIRDFADVLKSFEVMLQAIAVFQDLDLTSPLLIRLVKSTPRGKFPTQEMTKLLSHFRYSSIDNIKVVATYVYINT